MSLRRYEQELADTPVTHFQDLRGLPVYDQDNHRLGKVCAVVVNTADNETVYAEIASPSILGLILPRRRLVRRNRLRHNARGLRLTRTPSQR